MCDRLCPTLARLFAPPRSVDADPLLELPSAKEAPPSAGKPSDAPSDMSAMYSPLLSKQPPVPRVPSKLYKSFVANSVRDLSGQIAIVTGANSGLGYWTARALAAKGATVVLACRDVGKGRQAKAEIEADLRLTAGVEAVLEVAQLDLASFASVRAFAAAFRKAHGCVHVLVNNAGLMGVSRHLTADGWDVQLQVNHLAHFLLTYELFDLMLRAPGGARVVSHSSLAHKAGSPRINVDDLNEGGADGFCGLAGRIPAARPWVRYGQSKLANVLFALELHRRLQAAGLDARVKSVCAHPGFASTQLQQVAGGAGNMPGWRFFCKHFAQSAEDGALPLILAATHPLVESGAFYGPEKGTHGAPVRCKPAGHANDEAMARELWVRSELACGVHFAVGQDTPRAMPHTPEATPAKPSRDADDAPYTPFESEQLKR